MEEINNRLGLIQYLIGEYEVNNITKKECMEQIHEHAWVLISLSRVGDERTYEKVDLNEEYLNGLAKKQPKAPW